MKSLILLNGSVYSKYLLCLMLIRLLKVILCSKSRLPSPEFSGYHRSSNRGCYSVFLHRFQSVPHVLAIASVHTEK